MKIERKYMAHYLNANFANDDGTASYVRLGKDLEEYSPELSANVEKKSNILGETYCGADAVDSDCIVAGRWVLFTFDGQRLDFNGGGGLSSGKLAQATAAESDVLSGKKILRR